jgi:hypothetical protein
MLTKQDYIESLQHEYRVIRHLFEQIPVNAMDYRPSDKQRSMHELLAYIGSITGSMMYALSHNGEWSNMKERMDSITPENFVEKISEDEKYVIETFNFFTDEDFAKELDVFRMGVNAPIRKYLNDMTKILVGYKMQLFLYIKASGNYSIGTSNLWGGFSM